jgi:hypothetical protein
MGWLQVRCRISSKTKIGATGAPYGQGTWAQVGRGIWRVAYDGEKQIEVWTRNYRVGLLGGELGGPPGDEPRSE